MSSWRWTTLGEVCAEAGGWIQTGPFGSQLHARDYVQDGTPSVMPQNIGDNRIVSDDISLVADEDMERLRKYWLQTGDIVYSRRGDVERRALVRSENDGWLCGTGCLRVRIEDQDVHDSRFVSYTLGLAETRAWITRHAVGATMLNLNTSILSAVPLRMPDIDRQRAIAEVLGALDDKNDANDRAVSIAMNLARTLFVRASAHGPTSRVGDITSMVSRGVTPRYTDDAGLIVINQKCVRGHAVTLQQARNTERTKSKVDRILQRDDVLVNSTGQGTLGRAARWTLDEEATVDSHITIVRFSPELVNVVCAGHGLLDAEARIEALAEGSTGQTELRRDLVASLEIRLPESNAQADLGMRLSALDDLAKTLRAESLQLGNTRDELLPLLMSGKLRVKEAERVVEEVT